MQSPHLTASQHCVRYVWYVIDNGKRGRETNVGWELERGREEEREKEGDRERGIERERD